MDGIYKTAQGKRLHEFFGCKNSSEISRILVNSGIDISHTAVRQSVLGLRPPSPKILQYIATHGGSVDFILHGTGTPESAPPAAKRARPEVVLDDGKGGIDLPVCGMAAAADGGFEFANDGNIDEDAPTVRFPSSRPGDCVIRIEGASMEPWYPSGTLALLRRADSCTLRNGSRAVAVLPSGETVCKVFCATSKTICLYAINQIDGRDYALPRGEQSEGLIIYKIIQTLRNEDTIDSAMHDDGIVHFWQAKLAEQQEQDGDRVDAFEQGKPAEAQTPPARCGIAAAGADGSAEGNTEGNGKAENPPAGSAGK